MFFVGGQALVIVVPLGLDSDEIFAGSAELIHEVLMLAAALKFFCFSQLTKRSWLVGINLGNFLTNEISRRLGIKSRGRWLRQLSIGRWRIRWICGHTKP